MNKINESWGMQEEGKGKFWADDPARHAAAQKVDQKTVRRSWARRLIPLTLLCVGFVFLIAKMRR